MGGVEERPAAGQLDGLLREVRRQAARGADPDLGRILDWLYRQTGSHVALVADGTGRVEAATEGFPLDALPALAPLLTRLSAGQLAAAATDVGALRMRCEGLGTHEPRPVLVVAGSSEPAPEEAALISHVGTALTLLRHAEGSERTWRDYQRKAGQLRFAVLQALLAGEPLLARRMTTGVVPPLLDAGRLRIHLLHCPPSERDRISRAQQDPSGYHGPDLMVHCPVFKEHLICLVADDDDEEEGEGDRSGERGRGQGSSSAASYATIRATRWESAAHTPSTRRPTRTTRPPTPWPPPAPRRTVSPPTTAGPRWTVSSPAGRPSTGPARSCAPCTPSRRPAWMSPAWH